VYFCEYGLEIVSRPYVYMQGGVLEKTLYLILHGCNRRVVIIVHTQWRGILRILANDYCSSPHGITGSMFAL